MFNNIQQNPYIYLFKRMWKYAPSKGALTTMLGLSGVSKLLGLVEPRIFGKIVNLLQLGGSENWNLLLIFLVGYVAISLVSRIFHGTSRIMEEKMKFEVGEAFTLDMFNKVTALPMDRQNDNHSGKTIDKINKAIYALRSFAGGNFMYLDTLIFSIGSIIALASIWPKAGVVMTISGAIIFFIVHRFDQKLIPMIKNQNKKEHVVMSTLFDFLSNIKSVITLRFEKHAGQLLLQKIHDVKPIFLKYRKLNELKRFSMDFLMTVVISLIIGWYIFEQFSVGETVMIGTFTMLFQYAQRMSRALDNFTWQYSGVVTKKADMESVDDILEAYDNLAPTYQVDLHDDWKHISIQDLSFSYKNQKETKNTLDNVSLDLGKTSKIALVGESGSGKSTLMSLLRGLYDVDHVGFHIDNKHFEDLHPLANLTSLIPQDPEIFENTIRYNICMGLDISDEIIMEYADLAGFGEVIGQLPQGLDTDIKEKGVNLSGGQKQRLALCRGLLVANDSDIILLDEPTSSVDSVNERKIYGNILQKFADQCVISSIHKLHLLELFDYVYVFENGILQEEGSFADLIASKGHLSTMRETYQINHAELSGKETEVD